MDRRDIEEIRGRMEGRKALYTFSGPHSFLLSDAYKDIDSLLEEVEILRIELEQVRKEVGSMRNALNCLRSIKKD